MPNPESPTIPRIIAASFATIFFAWLCALAGEICLQLLGGFGYVTDWAFWLLWPAIYVVAAWLFAVLPILILTPLHAWFRFLPKSLLAWPVLLTATYTVLMAVTCGFVAVQLMWWPALMGIVAGFLYPLFVRRVRTWICFVAPVLSVPLFFLVLWPAFQRLSPYTCYVIGTPEVQARSMERIFATIHPGDDLSELHRRYPKIFPPEVLGMSGSTSTDEFDYHYYVEFHDRKVSAIHFEKRPRP